MKSAKEMRDNQKSKAYKWEEEFYRTDKKIVPFAQAQSIVDFVWHGEGLINPPKVVKFRKGVFRKEATGARFEIQIHERGCITSVLLHEIAHAMTEGHAHGPRWVGMFMILLSKYNNISMPVMMHRAKEQKLEFDLAGPDFSQVHCLQD